MEQQMQRQRQRQRQRQEEDQIYEDAITMVYAISLHNDLVKYFTEWVGVYEFPIFSHVYDNFLAYLEKQANMSSQKITQILNAKLYDWYFGNCISDFVVMIFMPRLILGNEAANVYMTKFQVHDAYRTLYRLVHFYNVQTATIDYYGDVYHAVVADLCLRSLYNGLPEHIKEAIPQFHCLLKHGSNLILIQEAFMKKFILRKQREKRIKAYLTIANWWFDIVNSPYTMPGQRLLHKRAHRFSLLVGGGN